MAGCGDGHKFTSGWGFLLPHTDRIGQDVDVGLVRVNYRWGGPVVVRY
jgi:outer membrane immunogenic protein